MEFIKTQVKHIGDPFILSEGVGYYMYATSSSDGFKVWYSEDLYDWKDMGLCYFREKSWGYDCFWAPEVVKRYDGKYVMHFTAKSRKSKSLRVGVAVADSPEGPFVDTGMPMFDFGYAAIDASAYIGEEGNYLYYSRDCSENVIDGVHISQIYVAPLSKDLMTLAGAPQLITTPDVPWETSMSNEWRWNEGPSVIKHDGVYYLTYSSNCYDCRYYSVGYATSDRPDGPFTKAAENPIMKYEEGKYSGPGHNAFFVDKQGQLRTSFHIHTDYDHPSGDRTACICKVKIENGKMSFGGK